MPKSKYSAVASEYDKIRPAYPKDLIDKLISSTGINPSSTLLEIGAGTGLATMPLAKKGFNIDCVEVEPRMAEILISKLKEQENVSVTVADFETWDSGNLSYDLIFSAQAFHWIDEKIKYRKCYDLLKENGQLAVFWYYAVNEPPEAVSAVNELLSTCHAGYACSGVDDCQKFFRDQEEQLINSQYFEHLKVYTFESERSGQNAETFISRINTTSAFASLDHEARQALNKGLEKVIYEKGGNIDSKLYYAMFIANKHTNGNKSQEV